MNFPKSKKTATESHSSSVCTSLQHFRKLSPVPTIMLQVCIHIDYCRRRTRSWLTLHVPPANTSLFEFCDFQSIDCSAAWTGSTSHPLHRCFPVARGTSPCPQALTEVGVCTAKFTSTALVSRTTGKRYQDRCEGCWIFSWSVVYRFIVRSVEHSHAEARRRASLPTIDFWGRGHTGTSIHYRVHQLGHWK